MAAGDEEHRGDADAGPVQTAPRVCDYCGRWPRDDGWQVWRDAYLLCHNKGRCCWRLVALHNRPMLDGTCVNPSAPMKPLASWMNANGDTGKSTGYRRPATYVDRKVANVAAAVVDRGYQPKTERTFVCATCNYRTTAVPHRTLRGQVYCSATCFQLAGH